MSIQLDSAMRLAVFNLGWLILAHLFIASCFYVYQKRKNKQPVLLPVLAVVVSIIAWIKFGSMAETLHTGTSDPIGSTDITVTILVLEGVIFACIAAISTYKKAEKLWFYYFAIGLLIWGIDIYATLNPYLGLF
jgi:hypothetical protein